MRAAFVVLLSGLLLASSANAGPLDFLAAGRVKLMGGDEGGGSSPPWFCRGKDCRRYKLEDEKEDKYSVRTYEEAAWVTYNTTGKFEVAMGKAFTALYRYFSGSNEREAKFELTTPYLTRVELKEGSGGAETTGNYTVGLMVPHKEWDDVPKPTLESLELACLPRETYAVRFVGGFATESSFLEERGKLRDMLKNDGLEFDDSFCYAAVYDAPTRLTDRYNEVHIRLKGKKGKKGGGGLPAAA